MKNAVIKSVVLVISLALMFSGCNRFGSKQTPASNQKVTEVPREDLKTQLRKKLDYNFTDAETHYKLGKLYEEDGLWSKAEIEFNRTLSFKPTHYQAQAALVKVLQANNDTQKAVIMADIYLNQVSGSAEKSLLLGQAFQRELMDDYALSCYKQALRLAPNSAVIHKQIGYYYLAKGDKVRAEEYLRQSFRLNPNQPEVAGELGRLGVLIDLPKTKTTGTKKLEKIVEKEEKQQQQE
ncbi:MAG: hypothetical protein ABIG61_10415 [Planctomycetota bacterium]